MGVGKYSVLFLSAVILTYYAPSNLWLLTIGVPFILSIAFVVHDYASFAQRKSSTYERIADAPRKRRPAHRDLAIQQLSHPERIHHEYEGKYRCAKCKHRYKDFLDSWICRYCQRGFCTKDRLPEKHVCPGNPRAPPKAGREIVSGGTRIVVGK